MKRKPTRLQMQRLARIVDDHVESLTKPEGLIWLEMPPLEERGWSCPRIFCISTTGHTPDEITEWLFEFEDGLPGWPATPEVQQAITDYDGTVWTDSDEGNTGFTQHFEP